MEGGLGSTRMGSRSSTRHGPASVFQGRVRRWRKTWAPVVASPSPSAAASRVLLYKWTPVTLPSSNGTKESTPEEPALTKPLRYLPVSVVLQQRIEEARQAAEDAEAQLRMEQEAQAATNPTGEAETADPQQDASLDASLHAEGAGELGSGSTDEGQNGSEPGHEEGEDEAQESVEAIDESLQEESNVHEVPGTAPME